ncbi:hypothetical protein, partial [Bacillus subtilis]|uniref:hypothetical protein n=1 Tax=Bacillus subtilis TaxID=1423 RepID=UPI001BDB95A0
THPIVSGPLLFLITLLLSHTPFFPFIIPHFHIPPQNPKPTYLNKSFSPQNSSPPSSFITL